MKRGSGIALCAVAVLGAVWACNGETRAPSHADAGSGGTDSSGDTGGTSGAGAPSDLDAGVGGGAPGSDASVSEGITERKFCGFDGSRFTTYDFPSGESVGSFDVEPLRSFGQNVSVDSAHDEVFVQSCDAQRSCSVAVFAADSTGFAPPVRSIPLPTNVSFHDAAVDPSSDTLILTLRGQGRSNEPVRVVTVPREASDLSAAIREFQIIDDAFSESFVLDAERHELYFYGNGAMRVYAQAASGTPEPLRTLPPAPLFSPARGEYHVWTGTTLETYPLPAPAAPEALPLRTLTLPSTSDSIDLLDEVNGELWFGSSVFDLTASGQAVSLRSRPPGRAVGVLAERDEVVFQNNRGDLEFYGRTAEEGPPLRVIEGAGDPTQHLLAVDAQRDEVFFVGATGIISVYARAASGDPAPLRRLKTSLRPGSALLDSEGAELIGGLYNQWVAYPVSAVGEAQPSRSFGLLDNEYLTNDFSMPVLDRGHGQLLGVVGAGSYRIGDVDPYTWEPRYVAFSSSGETQPPYPVAPIVSWRGRPPADYGEGRLVRVDALAYDSVRDEVVLAVKDCLAEVEEGLEIDFVTYSDCHHDLRSYPRTGGTAYTTMELPEEVHALAYDSRNDMLMLSGQTSVMFVDRAQQRGDSIKSGWGSDAGVVPNGGSSSVVETTYQFPLAGTFQYCD